MDIRLSEVISALSYALDVTEGQPMGHAVRSDLVYALLLKDAGCSSNAARLSSLFGADDLELKRTRKLIDHHQPRASLRHVLRHGRTRRLAAIARSGAEGAREMTELRCERGADIARMIELPETTAAAIRSLDEHWDGAGYPYGLAGDAIPLFGRIPLLGPDRRGVLRRRRPARGARRRGRAPRHLVRPRVGAFRDLAATAGAHHERLDGGGYHLGLTGDQLNRDARILAVADVCEALTAERPYRAALPPDQVWAIMRRDAGHALRPEALGALEASQELGVCTVVTPASAPALPLAR